jgi:hypothetical protein
MLGRKKYRARPKAAHDLEKSHPLQLWITMRELKDNQIDGSTEAESE